MSILRFSIGVIFIFLGLVLFTERLFNEDTKTVVNNILEGLVTEFIGIVITVVIIDRYFERRQKKDTARRLGLHILYEINRCIWIWQGGNPWFNLNELREITRGMVQEDPIAKETLHTLIRLGNMAKSLFNEEKDLIGVQPHLRRALECITSLADYNENSALSSAQFDMVKECLLSSISHLERVVGKSREESTFTRSEQDISIQTQRSRYNVRHDTFLYSR